MINGSATLPDDGQVTMIAQAAGVAALAGGGMMMLSGGGAGGGSTVGSNIFTTVTVWVDGTLCTGGYYTHLIPSDQNGTLTVKAEGTTLSSETVSGSSVPFAVDDSLGLHEVTWTVSGVTATNEVYVAPWIRECTVSLYGPEHVGVGLTNMYIAVSHGYGSCAGFDGEIDGDYTWSIIDGDDMAIEGVNTGETINVVANSNSMGICTLQVIFEPDADDMFWTVYNEVDISSVIEMDLKYPKNKYSEDTVADGTIFHYTFDDSATGVCQVSCVVVATPDNTDSQSFLTGKIDWTIDNISDSTLSWLDDTTYNSKIAVYLPVLDYWKASALYTGLPLNNNSLGNKTASYTVSELDCEGYGTAKIFFTGAAKNHTGTGSGTIPNWYYYWS